MALAPCTRCRQRTTALKKTIFCLCADRSLNDQDENSVSAGLNAKTGYPASRSAAFTGAPGDRGQSALAEVAMAL